MIAKEQFIKIPREVLESDAFGSLGINGFRVVRFLMIEHMRRGGRQNGNLKAPHRQLVAFGIAPRLVTDAIREAEESGLVVCHRHGLRIATTYELTWLHLHDGSAPRNAWQEYRAPMGEVATKGEICLPKVRQGCLPKGRQIGQNCLPKGRQSLAENCLPKGRRSIERSYHGGGNGKVKEEEGIRELVRGEPVEVRLEGQGHPAGKPEQPAARCPWYVTGPTGFRICGHPTVDGAEHCAEHTSRMVGA